MSPFNRLFLKFKNVCTGFETLLKGGKAVQRRLFDDMTLEYFMPRSVDQFSRSVYVHSELRDRKLEFIFDNSCHCTFRCYLNLQTHCSICKVLYVKHFIKTIPHTWRLPLASSRPVF